MPAGIIANNVFFYYDNLEGPRVSTRRPGSTKGTKRSWRHLRSNGGPGRASHTV